MKRSLTKGCEHCNEGCFSLTHCFNRCSIPVDILRDVEDGKYMPKISFVNELEALKNTVSNSSLETADIESMIDGLIVKVRN